MKTLRLGTRKSALAQAQTNWVAERLRASFPDLRVELVLITTTGDRQSSTSPLEGEDKGGGAPHPAPPPSRGERNPHGGLKALFTKEIEEALLDNRIDLAVHSMKDLAAELPLGLAIGAVPAREDPRDAWISKTNIPFANLPKDGKVGTGAVRRQAQLKNLRPDLNIVPLRGNVDTRLGKLFRDVTPVKTGVHEVMDSGVRRNDEMTALDGIILAMAGLKRLRRSETVTEALGIDVLLPAVGQGSLAIEIRGADAKIIDFVKALDHPASHQAALAERAFLKKLGGSCQTPIAGHASIETGELTIKGLVLSPDGHERIGALENGRPFDAQGVGERLAEKLLACGADKLLNL